MVSLDTYEPPRCGDSCGAKHVLKSRAPRDLGCLARTWIWLRALIALDKEVFVKLVAAHSLRRWLLLMSASEVISAKQRFKFQDHPIQITINVTTGLLESVFRWCFRICLKSKPKRRGISFPFQSSQFDLIASKTSTEQQIRNWLQKAEAILMFQSHYSSELFLCSRYKMECQKGKLSLCLSILTTVTPLQAVTLQGFQSLS